MSWRAESEPVASREAFEKLTIDYLKPLARFFTPKPPTRKGDLVTLITQELLRPGKLRELYEGLDPIGQAVVQEAAHDPAGRFDPDRFRAKYGELPRFYETRPEDERRYGGFYGHRSEPTRLRLLFPDDAMLPTDFRMLLREFVPAPRAVSLPTRAELPASERLSWEVWDQGARGEAGEEVPLRQRDTTGEAFHDMKAVLRLIAAGKVRVTDKKRQPTAATVKAVAGVLQGGDFYAPEDESDYGPGSDLAIKAFAWPMLVQAAGLADRSGDNLVLTAAGQKALSTPPQTVPRAAWRKWRASTLLDEFSRIDEIKGQGKARLSAVANRRKVVLDGLAECPPGQWVAVDDFFRFLIATGRDFEVARDIYPLYISEHYYGNLGQAGDTWELLQGRFILAFLFEYAATLGVVDVGYLPPEGVRGDYTGLWGTDELAYLSRYDGLRFFRLTAFGAWCLGLSERYEPPAPAAEERLQVLPNREVVVMKPPLPAGDRLLLERFAEQRSDAVWQLSATRALAAVEEGGSLAELEEFLAARATGPLPQTVAVFLDDLRQRGGRLRDLGMARLVECADAETARLLATDPQLRGTCELAGERRLVFLPTDEAAVRKALHRRGYVLPPPRE
jgi:hypothetical protein